MLEYCYQKCLEIPLEKDKARVYSVITNRRGIILAEASNMYGRSHPLQKKYSIKSGHSDKRIFLHSETRVICQAAKYSPKDCKITVVRIGNSGKMLNSCPCESCKLLIEDCGFIKFTQYHVEI